MNFDPHRPLSGIDQDAADCVAAMRGNSHGCDRYHDTDNDRADTFILLASVACVGVAAIAVVGMVLLFGSWFAGVLL